jgi:hypothetical protein
MGTQLLKSRAPIAWEICTFNAHCPYRQQNIHFFPGAYRAEMSGAQPFAAAWG